MTCNYLTAESVKAASREDSPQPLTARDAECKEVAQEEPRAEELNDAAKSLKWIFDYI